MKKQQKFKSAEEKQKFLSQQKSWEDLKRKHGGDKSPMTAPSRTPIKRERNPRISELRQHASLDTGVTGAVTSKSKVQVYTGDKIIGIATMHKSNLVPIFNNDAAEDVSKMRR